MTQANLRSMCGWQLGREGEEIADLFGAINRQVFGGKVPVLPISFPRTLPYGRSIGMCHWCSSGEIRCIELKEEGHDRYATLLHEMLHAYLRTIGENPKHDGKPWCREVMRITQLLWKKEVWATPPQIGKRPADANGKRKSYRFQPSSPSGMPSMSQKEIAGWPHDSMFVTSVKTLLLG